MKTAKIIKGLIALLAVSMASVCWGNPVTFRGQATAANVTVLGINTVLGDTGVLGSKGGVLENDLATVNIPLVLSGVIAHGDVVGVGDHTEASATVTGLNVLCGGVLVTADLIQSRVYVKGSSNQAPVATGSSQLANLVVAGVPIVITGAPNQTIKLPVGKIVINEHTQGTGSITVIALHIVVNGIADIKLARATAGVGACSGCTNTCTGTPNCSGNFDILTGGGTLLNTFNRVAHFGLGLNNGATWGGFLFDDGDSLTHFQATGITQYLLSSASGRHIEGTGKLNGLFNVTYILDIVDNGAQGSIFTLNLSNGYKITGPVALGFLHLQQACN